MSKIITIILLLSTFATALSWYSAALISDYSQATYYFLLTLFFFLSAGIGNLYD